MDIIVGPSGSGKTSELVEWVKKGHVTEHYPHWSRVLIVNNREQADRLRSGSDAVLDFQQVFSYEEWSRGYRLDPTVEIALDEVEDLLTELLNRRISIITMSPANILHLDA